MGIIATDEIKNKISNLKKGIEKKVPELENEINNKISEMSDLSLQHIAQIEEKKKEYFDETNIMESDDTFNLIQRQLGVVGIEVYQAYLSELSNIYTPISTISENFSHDNRIAYFDITRWVLNADENYIDKLINVYHVLSGEDCNIALIFDRTCYSCTVTMAVVNTSKTADPLKTQSDINRLIDAIKGNFPGATLKVQDDGTALRGIPPCLKEHNERHIASVTNIAAEKSEKFISQSIEKLLDGVALENDDQSYTFILLASPVKNPAAKKLQISELYTKLAPFASYQTNFTNTESENKGASATGGINIGIGVPHVANFGANFSRASNVNVSIGKSEGITKTYTNHQIKHALDILDIQMKRLEQGAALGMWDFASYVLSKDYNTASRVAHMYLALTQGEESYIVQSAINIWHSNNNKKDTEILFNEISHLHHPSFLLKNNLDGDWLMYPTSINATTTISGKELAYSFNFPRKSVSGLPVIECAEFGRNISTYDEQESGGKINLGKIFHMNRPEQTDVELNKNSLASHTFITGSTNAGKSNTVYKILDEAKRNGVKFLVVEPAKGEYKKVFGNNEGVYVYGTNKAETPLLRLDPFSFPEKKIHVLEHLDRLIEIFNVCWPMYAAMPAVLKNAVEKSYEDCGWDLVESTNEFGKNLYPNFADVARNVKQIINSSEYDTDNKGAYKGALLTRLNSLTNGINGLIFQNDEITAKELFDENVIVDLSRVGSMETKSLIMGMLVLKLQEYRMSCDEMNAKLRHLTVLEEAHNLLKRTSTEQITESSNLIGKSVEMISNAIAEMRTYGEGFIIADQAPGLLDMAVIRNTNTKIIMRLPDLSDRELVGKAANLNDSQIAELAKLPQGVAAIYQNEWIQPVLCKVEEYEYDKKAYNPPTEQILKTTLIDFNKSLKIAELLSNGTAMNRELILTEITPILEEMKIASSVHVAILMLLQNPLKEPRMTKLAPIMSALFPNVRKAIESAYSESHKPIDWTVAGENELKKSLNAELKDQVRRDIIQAIVTDYAFNKLGKIDDVELWSKEGLR